MSRFTTNRGLFKPPSGASVRWGHPLTAGLQFAILANEGSGSAVYDAAGRISPSALVNQAAWTVDQYGPCLQFDGTDDHAENTTYPLPTQAVTILQIINTPDGGQTGSSFGNRDSSSANSERCQTHLPFSGTVYWDFGGASGSNRTQYTPNSSFWNRWNVMVFVAGPVGSQIWENGVSKASSSTPITRSAGANGFFLARYGTSFVEYQECKLSTVMLWDRCLTNQEIQQVSFEPYSFFTDTRAVRYFIPPPSNVTGTSAVTAPAATLTASGTIVNAYTGTSAVTAAAATMAATGTVVNPAAGFGSNFQLLGIG
jgi:hypothetical protein